MADLTKEEKQAFIRDTLISRYTKNLRVLDKDDSSLGKISFVSDFQEISSGSCYEIHNMLKNHKVLPKSAKWDHEHSCCFYYFKDMATAKKFVNNLAVFMVKRLSIANEYHLITSEVYEWFEKVGCFNFPKKSD